MRFIHTADWHLGRLFHGIHLTDDQAHLLEQLVALIADEKPDALIISGDIYDRAIPPVEAVDLLNETLTEIALDHQIPIVLIAGNHDNPERLGFGYRLFAKQGLHVFGSLDSCKSPLTLHDDHGQIDFFSCPYAEPATVRFHLQDEAVVCCDSAMRAMVQNYNGHLRNGTRSVMLAHAFVHGGNPSESERPLSVGGTETVHIDCFNDFSYVALGHLHRPQSFHDGRVRYSGSLMRYSFDEASHNKSISIVDIDGAGLPSIEEIELTPRRQVRQVRGTLNDLLQQPEQYGDRNDYIDAVLTDTGALYDPLGRLREVYPNLLHIERELLSANREHTWSSKNLANRSDLDLFNDFMDQMTGQPLTAEQEVQLRVAIDAARDDERGMH